MATLGFIDHFELDKRHSPGVWTRLLQESHITNLAIQEQNRLGLNLPQKFIDNILALHWLSSGSDFSDPQDYSGRLDHAEHRLNFPQAVFEAVAKIPGWENLTNDQLTLNVPFWTQHIAGNPEKQLRVYDPKRDSVLPVDPKARYPLGPIGDLFYKIADKDITSHETLDKLQWRFFVKNYDEIKRYFEIIWRSDVIILQNHNTLVISNHITWASLPFLAFCFHHFLGIPKQQLYTLVWPAIMTAHADLAGIERFSNVITTWPDTEKANTGYPSEKIEIIRNNAIRKMIEIFSPKDSKKGKVLFMAPSGTRDNVVHDWLVEMIPPSSWTEKLIDFLLGKMKLLWLPIWVNDAAFMWKDGKPKRGHIHVEIWDFSMQPNDLLQNLPYHVIDNYGESIWRWKDI